MQKNIGIQVLLLLLVHCVFGAKDSMLLRGDIDYLKDGDEVLISIHKYGPGSEAPLVTEVSIQSKGHTFETCLPVFTPMESINISFPKHQPYYSNYFVKAGDCVLIKEKGGKISFSGKGAARYNVQYALYNIYHYYGETPLLLKEDLSARLNATLRLLELGRMKCMEYLEKEKDGLSVPDFTLLKAEMIVRYEIQYRNAIHYDLIYSDSFRAVITPIIKEYRKKNLEFGFSQKILPDRLAAAPSYPDYIFLCYTVDSVELLNRPFDPKMYYHYVVTHFGGLLRQRLITQLVFKIRNLKNDDFAFLITDGLGYVKQPYLKEILEHLRETRLTGHPAYNFSLPDIHGQKRQLTDFGGKVVLLDFWFTGCGFCRLIHPFLDSVRNIFKGQPFELVSICTDKDKGMWKQSIATHQYTSVENVNLITQGYDNPLIKYYNITAYPTLLLIDKYGKICSAVSDPRGDHAKLLIAQIEKELNK